MKARWCQNWFAALPGASPSGSWMSCQHYRHFSMQSSRLRLRDHAALRSYIGLAFHMRTNTAWTAANGVLKPKSTRSASESASSRWVISGPTYFSDVTQSDTCTLWMWVPPASAIPTVASFTRSRAFYPVKPHKTKTASTRRQHSSFSFLSLFFPILSHKRTNQSINQLTIL